jgi:hypothetical protein
VAADGPSAPRLPHPPPEPALPAHDRLEEGVTGPSCHRWPSCAAGAVRTSCSWAILKLMHVSINAGGDACIGRLFTSRPTRSPVKRVQPKDAANAVGANIRQSARRKTGSTGHPFSAQLAQQINGPRAVRAVPKRYPMVVHFGLDFRGNTTLIRRSLGGGSKCASHCMAEDFTETLELARAALIPFLENNPTSKIGPGPKADAAFILRPWGDETMTLEIPQRNNEISEILNNVIMPERYSALRHLKTGDFEVIFSAYPLPV